MNRSAVVFSPHYDDETLGAGGTVIQKCRAGASVYLVFMTDGSRSHAHAMDGASLSALRRQEARHAAAALGIPENHVRFLEFPELRLMEHRAAAVQRVAELLLEFDCAEVFVPSTLEPLLWSSDHKATTRIVFEALDRCRLQPVVVEYLVWFWYHWPWVSFRGTGATLRQIGALTWTNRFGLTALRELNTAVPIGNVASQKHAALDMYESQMTRLKPGAWPTLSDVAQGEFLQQFFQPSELFKCYKYQSAPPRSAP